MNDFLQTAGMKARPLQSNAIPGKRMETYPSFKSINWFTTGCGTTLTKYAS